MSKKVRAAADIIRQELLRAGPFIVLDGISPEDVTEEALPWRLHESLQILQIRHRFQLGGQAPMQSKELVID